MDKPYTPNGFYDVLLKVRINAFLKQRPRFSLILPRNKKPRRSKKAKYVLSTLGCFTLNQWRIQGRGPAPFLILDLTEARIRRAEKVFGRPGFPLSQALDKSHPPPPS